MSTSSSWYIITLPYLVAIKIVIEDIIMFLVCHVISQYHRINGPKDFIDKSPSRQVTKPPSLVAMSTMVAEMQ